jgi:hypothetical protein
VPNMEVTVGFRWETGDDFVMFPCFQVLDDDIPDEIGGRGYAFTTHLDIPDGLLPGNNVEFYRISRCFL